MTTTTPPSATELGSRPGPIPLVTVFLAGAVSCLVGLALCLAMAVWWIKARVLGDASGPNPKPSAKELQVTFPSETTASTAASHTSTSRRALELLLREKDTKDDASFSSTSSSSPSRGAKSSAVNNQLMGWLNIYRVPVLCASSPDADSQPIAASSSSSNTTTLIDSHSPSSPPAPSAGYVGAGHQYAALHRPRSIAAAPSSERLPGALSCSNPDLMSWPPLASSPSLTTSTAAALPAPAPSSASTASSSSMPSSSRRSSTTLSSTPHTRAFDRAKSPTCFGVLRHHSLFLYDDETLLDCVGVILLPLHSVALHAPPGAAQGRVAWDDSECFVKDTPIRLSRVANKESGLSRSKDAWDPVVAGVPLAVGQEQQHVEQRDFFLYAMNAVEKEAWYLALRRASATGTHESTHPPHFYSSYSALRSTLLSSPHSSPPDHSTLWLNALIGRAFLTVQDHPLLTRYLLTKFTKKLDRLPALPGFLSSLRVASVDPGTAAPILTNPALVKCDATGHVEVELDIAYTGSARVQLAADVVLSLGTTVASIAGKLGAGDGVAADLRVPVVLGVTLAEVRGRLRVALRPPPSNRAWVGFVDAPKLVVRAEPVVNTKQLRLAMVLDLIESKVRDLLVASMVLPNMEDVCIAPSGWDDEGGDVEGGRFYPKAGGEGESEGKARAESVRSMATSVAASSTTTTAGVVGRERSRSITSMWSAMSAAPLASPPTSPRTRLSTIPGSPADSMHATAAYQQRAMVLPFAPRPTTSTSHSSPPTTLSRSSTASSTAGSSASSLSPWTSLAAASTLNLPGSEYPRSVKRGFGVVHDHNAHDDTLAHHVPPLPPIPAHFAADASDDGDAESMLRHRRAYSGSMESGQGTTTATSRVVVEAAAAAGPPVGSSKSSSPSSEASASSFSFRSLFKSSSSGDGGRRG